MKVLNIHQREIDQPKDRLLELFATLATKDDKIWPKEKWPGMKFENGLTTGAAGGHGPIRYIVVKNDQNGLLTFKFQNPPGFTGMHAFEITELNDNKTAIRHTIDMNTKTIATLKWVFAIRWLHDALIEDAFDKVENYFTGKNKKTEWNIWVRFLRKILG